MTTPGHTPPPPPPLPHPSPHLRVVAHILLVRYDDVVVARQQILLQFVDGADLYYVVPFLDYLLNLVLVEVARLSCSAPISRRRRSISSPKLLHICCHIFGELEFDL